MLQVAYINSGPAHQPVKRTSKKSIDHKNAQSWMNRQTASNRKEALKEYSEKINKLRIKNPHFLTTQ